MNIKLYFISCLYSKIFSLLATTGPAQLTVYQLKVANDANSARNSLVIPIGLRRHSPPQIRQCTLIIFPVSRSSVRLGPQGDSVTTMFCSRRGCHCHNGVSVMSGTNGSLSSPFQSELNRLQCYTERQSDTMQQTCQVFILFAAASFNSINFIELCRLTPVKASVNNKFLRSLLPCCSVNNMLRKLFTTWGRNLGYYDFLNFHPEYFFITYGEVSLTKH